MLVHLPPSFGPAPQRPHAAPDSREPGLAATGADITVVIPTRNEAGNLPALVERLGAALRGSRAAIVFVDDSDDDTPGVGRDLAQTAAVPLTMIHRDGADRVGGLGTAVLAGLRASNAPWVVVMDADLQHPPELVTELVQAGIDREADVVVASRYTAGGQRGGLGSAARVAVSSGATTLSKWAFPRRLRGCSDPMSGFFAIRRDAVDADALRPNGFKILLEILARSPRLRVTEVPFAFGERLTGRSKASWREGLRFVRQLATLRAAVGLTQRTRRIATIVGFGAVGLTGIVVNSAALWASERVLGLSLLVAATVATQVSTTWNFVLTDLIVFRGRKARPWWVRFLGFAAVNNAVLIARLPVLNWLVRDVRMGDITANAITLVAAFAVRYLVADTLLFTRKKDVMTDLLAPPATPVSTPADRARPGDRAAGRSRSGPVDVVVDVRDGAAPKIATRPSQLTWHYDIHGLVRIGSVVRLAELDAFQTAGCPSLDVQIHRGVIDGGHLRMRSRVTQYVDRPSVSYQEHFGRFGSDFHIDMSRSDGPIEVTVGPMLERSPHVLYTNVVEALLRFLFVARGHMLLHSACIEVDGRGVMLSALTDTGKTGTVLRLLRERGARFLSDDMTVIGPDGVAMTYPKPMTISQHTLHAVHAEVLSRREFRRLRVQSRLHSKEGRAIGAQLGRRNLPIMSINALTQLVVPPPKYTAQRLVDCEAAERVSVEELFIISRGPDSHTLIEDRERLLDELIENTDDAYGFPPYRYFAPALVVGGLAYEELRAEERRILARALSGVRAHRLVAPDFSWADRVPDLAVRSGADPSTSRIVAAPVILQDYVFGARSGTQ